MDWSLAFASVRARVEGLKGINKLAVSMILVGPWTDSVIFSALTLAFAMVRARVSIIFIFYGWSLDHILIEKYDLPKAGNRYPKLAKLIHLRQKFQKYYLVLGPITTVILLFQLYLFAEGQWLLQF
jgi:hypothetical protein